MNSSLLRPPSPVNDEALRVAPGADSGVRVVTPLSPYHRRLSRLEAEPTVLMRSHCQRGSPFFLLRNRLLAAAAETYLDLVCPMPNALSDSARVSFLALASGAGCAGVPRLVDSVFNDG